MSKKYCNTEGCTHYLQGTKYDKCSYCRYSCQTKQCLHVDENSVQCPVMITNYAMTCRKHARSYNNCNHIKRDGSVCNFPCREEVCHRHTQIAINRRREYQRKKREQASAALRLPKDATALQTIAAV